MKRWPSFNACLTSRTWSLNSCQNGSSLQNADARFYEGMISKSGRDVLLLPDNSLCVYFVFQLTHSFHHSFK